jgi:hypothetical protein
MSENRRTRSKGAQLEATPADDAGESPKAQKRSRTAAISDYERERLENIQRNEDFLASLGLHSVKSELSLHVAPKQAPKRKVVAVKKVQSDAPLRRSGRVTIEKLQEEITRLQDTGNNAELLAEKQQELEAMLSKKNEGSYQVAADATYGRSEWKRLDAEPVPVTNMTYDPEKYNEAQARSDLAQLMTGLKNTKITTLKGGKQLDLQAYTDSLRKLEVFNDEVAKLTEDRITSVCFHPTTDKLVVFAGDKSGNLGVWDVSRTESSELHGVYKYRPHVSNIARIHASKFNPTAVHSTSYDGTVRLFDIEKECFTLRFQAPEVLGEMYFTEAEFLLDQPECMYVGTSDGSAALIDLRASGSDYMWKRPCESGYKLNSIQQHPTQPHLIVTAERTAISLYDVRKGSSSSRATMKALVSHVAHTHSINAAHVSPDGEYLVSVSQDSTIRTWRHFVSPTVDPYCVVTRHDNNTGRWLSTLRPTFDPKQPHAFILGCMLQPRRIEVFAPVLQSETASAGAVGKSTGKQKVKKEIADDESGFSLNLLCNLEDDLLGSVCSRNAFHPTLNVVAGGNSSGRIHIFREK